ncbi:MAG: hypothetical protein JXB32_05220 [Deltaproteobacteria bacterium]|nr:hypothetical protein [Deltaproteobacteria bacterium]
MIDWKAIESRRRARDRRRTAAAWAIFGVVSMGLHHLSLQALDVAGLGELGKRTPTQAVLLDLFQPPPPEVKPPQPQPPPKPAEQAKPPEPPPQPEEPRPEEPKPTDEQGGEAARPPRQPRVPRTPRIPEATPEDEANDEQLTLSSEYGDPYDPLNPRLRMSDWGDEDFAAADRYFGATDAAHGQRLAPNALRSPLEQIGPWNDWGGNASVASTNDFFAGDSGAIQLALNPERPDLLRYAPVDATVMAYLNLRAIQDGPHSTGVAGLLRTLPDYQSMVGNVETELLERAEELYITSSDPTDRAKTVVLIRHALSDSEIAAMIGRQITLAGGKPSWSTMAQRAAVTVDHEHAALTPWIYLFPEPGIVLVVHRANVTPLLAALDGQGGRGDQPQLVYQLRRMMEAPEPEETAADEQAPPTLFAVADSGTLGPHLRFLTRALSGADIGRLGGGYLRITGGERPEVLGGLRLAAPEEAPRWAELMRRIEDQELAKTFDFVWAGRDDRLFFRFGLTEPLVDSGLGLFRVWADRYYASEAVPLLPDAPTLPANVIGTAVRSSADAGADAEADDRIKDEADADRPKVEPDAGADADADADAG